jgi:hypothetical protein
MGMVKLRVNMAAIQPTIIPWLMSLKQQDVCALLITGSEKEN